MKIILVANHYVQKNAAMQGFMSYLWRTATAMTKFGHKVIIVACGEYRRHFVEENIEIYIEEVILRSLQYKPYEYLWNYIQMSKTVNKRIRKLCRKERMDIIQFTSLSGLGLCYFGKVPAVMRLSSYAKIAYQTHQTLNAHEERMISYLERIASKRCNAVFAPCENTAREFGRDIRRRVFVIESPFYNDVVKYDESVYRKNLSGKKYVLFFGRLYAEKGILVIADILYRFLQMHEDYYMVFCGETTSIHGTDARKLLKQSAKELSGQIKFFDPLPHESLYDLIRKAEFVILPSLMENLSNACIEAMYFGKTVIGTEGASFEQLITDGENGLLCKMNDAQSLLEKMVEAASMDYGQKEKMGILAQRRIDSLRPEVAVRRLIRFYQYVIRQNSR